MPESPKLKIFISWSDEPSRSIALLIRTWLPNLSDLFDPFMSEEDIDAGTRGLAVIAEALVDTSYGLAVVTPENQQAPWLTFETGALAREVGPDPRARVTPLLFGFDKSESLRPGPLIQFQYRKFEKGKVRDVIRSMAKLAGADEENVVQRFEWSWPDFGSQVEEALRSRSRPTGDATPEGAAESVTADNPVLAEILENTRALLRRSDPPGAPIRDVTDQYRRWVDSLSMAKVDMELRRDLLRLLRNFGIDAVSVILRETADGGNVQAQVYCHELPDRDKQARASLAMLKEHGIVPVFTDFIAGPTQAG
jgi:hypothetical protein